MTFQEMKNQVMFQTNNDADDMGDFTPAINDYINEGYGILTDVVYGVHLEAGGTYKPLSGNTDVPKLPIWMHRGIGDYATWMVFRNGNQLKQNRGYAFKQAFDTLLSQARLWAARQKDGAGQFYNIYP